MDSTLQQKENFIGTKNWIESYNKSFVETQKQCNITEKWLLYSTILNSKYKNNIIQPINGYSMHFSLYPKIQKENNLIRLTYYTHAEIWLELVNKDNSLYTMDRPAQRQFYPSYSQYNYENECFDGLYRFYLPWTINRNANGKVFECNNEYFKIVTTDISFNKIDKDIQYIEPQYISFLFKKNQKLITNKYLIINPKTPMFDIIVEDKQIVKELNEYI